MLGKDQFGLATAYSILKKHGGIIEIESKPGQGTSMAMWIPAADTAPSSPVDAPAASLTQSRRILIMDDEETIRDVGARVLRRLNCEAATVADGTECIRAYREALAAGRAFDLVIMDLTVPGGMGGIKTVAELRKIDPHVRAIVSSGYSKDPVLANFRDFGFCAVVAKPYDVAHLAAVIERVLSGRS
jgi:CheY-like chemotaxis protein